MNSGQADKAPPPLILVGQERVRGHSGPDFGELKVADSLDTAAAIAAEFLNNPPDLINYKRGAVIFEEVDPQTTAQHDGYYLATNRDGREASMFWGIEQVSWGYAMKTLKEAREDTTFIMKRRYFGTRIQVVLSDDQPA